MGALDKEKVRMHFDRGAATYDEYAVIQAEMAEKLLTLLPEGSIRRILEIGCGTGFLTERLVRRQPRAVFTVCDLSERMLLRTRDRLGHLGAGVRFARADAEQWAVDDSELLPGAPFDLIVSGATVQWFEHPPETTAALARRLLTGEGAVLFSTFGSRTFIELQESFRMAESILSLPPAPHGRPMVTREAWEKAFSAAGLKLTICEEMRTLHYRTVREFLRSVQRVGAGNAEHTAGGTGSLAGRSLLQAMEQAYEAYFSDGDGVRVTYQLLYGTAGRI